MKGQKCEFGINEVKSSLKKLFSLHPDLFQAWKKKGYIHLVDSNLPERSFKFDDIVIPYIDVSRLFYGVVGNDYMGSVYIENLFKYDWNVIKNACICSAEQDPHRLVFNYCCRIVGLDGFNADNIIPKSEDKHWSKERVLGNNITNFINDTLNDACGGCSVYRLHMSEDIPVLSSSHNFGKSDYDLTERLLPYFNVPVKEVYFLVNLTYQNVMGKYRVRKCSDGEYTITIY